MSDLRDQLPDPMTGRLLVATPALQSPDFDRTVVLVLEHGDHGALGVVLNRPSELAVAEPLPQWEPFVADPAVVFVGGPVAPSAAICLAQARGETDADAWKPLFDGLGTLDLEGHPEDVPVLDRLRVFAGYAGWGPGQLEGEIEEGAWFVVAAEPGDALSTEPRDLWRTVLRRQGGEYALVSTFPPDPTMN
jgi:putative transcriptional regulator